MLPNLFGDMTRSTPPANGVDAERLSARGAHATHAMMLITKARPVPASPRHRRASWILSDPTNRRFNLVVSKSAHALSFAWESNARTARSAARAWHHR
jgi:hypothetical protein